MLRRLFTRKPLQPVGRWMIGGNWQRRAQLASEDSCSGLRITSQTPFRLDESKEQQ